MSVGNIISTIIVGLIVGILARFFYPGAVELGWISSIVLGVAGSFLAGLISNWIKPGVQPLKPAGFFASILGAMLLIFVGRLLGLNF
ncbi:GlsB/YeaQ/YmgE family stress response membrane protein [Sphingomonas sp. DT-207]|uniref:GlsB/YeaQ/YmgE family stress response membrane protein n=1 Tax=Sphingomonas sp. DT-207 TaxID=3396167 RepID=UPI003F19D729